MATRESYQHIWDTIRKIPRGRVATYGQIAFEAGYPKQARLAGYALFNTPSGFKLPWHRVINAQGRISFPPRSEPYKKQKALLEKEGVVFLRGKVNLERFLWRPRSAAPVLD